MLDNVDSNGKISVVIPTHNRVKLLLRAVKSVQEQTYDNIEILVVSDGSTDNTSEVMKKMAAEDKRIKFINCPVSRGANAARNEGIKNAVGNYVAFLDDDDEWIKDKLACQMAVMNSSSKIGLVYTWIKIVYVDEGVEYISKPSEKGKLDHRILLGNSIGSTSSVMVKKSLIDNVGGFDVNLPARQDYDLWIRCCQKCDVGVVEDIKVNYYNYLNDYNEQISSKTQRYIDATKRINIKYKKYFDGLDIGARKIKKENDVINLLKKTMRNRDRGLADLIFRESLNDGINFKILFYYFLTYIPFKYLLYLKK